MDIMVHAKLHKPAAMPNQEFFGVWLEEAQSALAALESGAIKHIWKVPGKYEVIIVFDVESTDQLDEIIHSAPIWKRGYDYLMHMEYTPLRSYKDWALQLKELAAE